MARINLALRCGWLSSVAACLVLGALERDAHAGARQIHGGPAAGFATLIARDVSLGATVSGHLGYGITDAFRVYGSLDVPAGASIADGAFAVWPGAAVGVAYTLDNLSVVPWIALEARVHVPIARSTVGWAVGGGARLGVDWLASRYLGLSVQASYSALFFDGGLAHSVTVIAGPRWTVDL